MVWHSLKGYLCGACTILCFALDHSAQVYAQAVPTPRPIQRGTTLYKVRDLNNDGSADFIALKTINADGKGFDLVSIDLLSGKDMLLLGSIPPEREKLFNPRAFGIGDINGDGSADLAVISKSHGKRDDALFLYSGKDGTRIMRNVKLGKRGVTILAVAWLNDIDGDGIADFAVGTAQERPELRALQIVSGLTGSIIKRIEVKRAEQQFAQSLTTIDDIDGDGHPEIVSGGTPNAKARTGAFVVLSGATLKVLFEKRGGPGVLYGDDVIAGVDLNKDGYREFVVSEYDRAQKGHRFHFFNGRTFAELYSIGIFGDAARLNSRVVDFMSDIDYDCIPEVVISGVDGSLRLHLGTTGAFDRSLGGAPSFGMLGNLRQPGVPNSYKLATAERGSGAITITDYEPIFFPPPLLFAPECRYWRDPYL